MTCKDVAGFLMDYLDGELGAGTRRVFEAHLAECPECVNYIESYQQMMKLAKASLDAEDECDAPEPLVAAILAARRKGS